MRFGSAPNQRPRTAEDAGCPRLTLSGPQGNLIAPMRYKKSAQSAEQIVQSATKVLARQGYARTSLMDIAREAGMSKGAVHYHFSTKESLISEVLRTALERVQERTLAAWAEGEDSLLSMRSSLRELWRIRAERSEEAVIIADLLAQSLHDEKIRPRMAQFFRDASGQMQSHLEEQVELLGLTPKIPLDLLPRIVLGLLDGLVMQSYVEPEEMDVERVLSALETIALSLMTFDAPG